MAEVIITRFKQEGLEDYQKQLVSTSNSTNKLADSTDVLENDILALNKELASAKAKLSEMEKQGKANTQEYKKLATETKAVEIAMGGVGKTVGSVKTQMRAMQQEGIQLRLRMDELEDAGLRNTEAYKVLAKEYDVLKNKAGALKDTIGDVSAEIGTAGSDTRGLDIAIRGIQGVASGFQVAQGSLSLFGVENQELEKTLVRLNSVMAISQGLQQIQEELSKKDSIYTAIATKGKLLYALAVGQSTGAMKLFRIALVSTGIGAIIVLLGLLITNFDKVKKYVTNLFPALSGLGESLKGLKDIFSGVFNGISKIVENSLKPIVKTIKAVIIPTPANIKEALKSYKDLGNGVVDAFEQGKNESLAKRRRSELIASLDAESSILDRRTKLIESEGNKRLALATQLNAKEKALESAKLKFFKGELDSTVDAQVEYNNAVNDLREFDLQEQEKYRKKQEENYKKSLDYKKQAINDEITILEIQKIKNKDNLREVLEIDKKLVDARARLSKVGLTNKFEIELINLKAEEDKVKLVADYINSQKVEIEPIIKGFIIDDAEAQLKEIEKEIQKLFTESGGKITPELILLRDEYAKQKEAIKLMREEYDLFIDGAIEKTNALAGVQQKVFTAENFKKPLTETQQVIDGLFGGIISKSKETKAELKADLANGKIDYEDYAKAVRQANLDLASDIVMQVGQGFNTITSLMQQINQVRFANLEQQYKSGVISEKKYQAEVLRLRQREARINKANAIFNIILNTAQAVVRALGTGGPILAGIVGALGAVQLGIAIAQPIPKFKYGGSVADKFKGSGYVSGRKHEQGGRLAELEGNEFVIQSKAVSHYGKEMFDAFNNMKIAKGGDILYPKQQDLSALERPLNKLLDEQSRYNTENNYQLRILNKRLKYKTLEDV